MKIYGQVSFAQGYTSNVVVLIRKVLETCQRLPWCTSCCGHHRNEKEKTLLSLRRRSESISSVDSRCLHLHWDEMIKTWTSR